MSWLKITLHLILLESVLGQTNLTSYVKLPPLYNFHTYEDGLSSPSPSTYCMVFANIKPDNRSEVWQSIENFSEDTHHRFRHDYLVFGLSVAKCKELLLNTTTKILPNEVIKTKVPSTYQEVIDYYTRIYGYNVYDQNLNNFLDTCVNHEFQRNYNLTLTTFVEYCNDPKKIEPKANIEIVAFALLALLIVLNALSSAYDYNLKYYNDLENPQRGHRDTEKCDSLETQILTSFSVGRNFNKLLAKSTGGDASELDFTYFFRFFTIFFVIWGHTLMVITAFPLENPVFIENHLYRPETIIFQNGSTLIQIFFVLTAFLLKLKFDKLKPITTITTYTECFLVYLKVFFQRYFRILPSLALLLLFNSSLLKNFGDGPFWRHMVEGERTFCTKYWWKNVFMINNFMMEDSCAHQTWYLATDSQLFELYVIVLIITSKYPFTKKSIYALLGSLAFIVPGVLTYIYRLDASTYLRPEYYRYLYFQNADTLQITYNPFYCNLGGYLVGIICAEIYTKSVRYRDLTTSLAKYRTVQKIQIPFIISVLSVGFGLLFTGLFVVNRNSKDGSIWVALYAACYRNIWAIFSGFVLMSMLSKFGGLAYDISNCGIFRLLGRLTFQMYLWHVPILRILFGSHRHPIYLNQFYVFCQIILAIILSISFAFVLTIFVEYPIGNVINIFFKRAFNVNKLHAENKQFNEMNRYTT
uniref:Acyltransferase 3 domain-containing protein n=2 Tax=Stomoxys calcitrans TaxID=35570 RepID=A0A1I8PHK2_STOCA